MIECSICKSSSQDGSIYCSECGQRLQQAANSSSKLHSPLLDASIYEQNSPTQADSTSHPGSPAHNGLHSPILDAWSTQPLEEDLPNPRSKFKQGPELIAELSAGLSAAPSPRADSGQTNKPTRLHSPVLDGPGQTNRAFEPEDLDMPVEEYNSLRSPLLGAKVPLPEDNKAVTNLQQQPTIQSLLGPSSLFNQSPVETGDRPPVRSPRQTGHFSKITGLKRGHRRSSNFVT